MIQKPSTAAVSLADFAKLYCETQDCTPAKLHSVLLAQIERYHPTGFMLLECHQMDSSRLGSRVILPYGPNNTFKDVPSNPISPRGLASDISLVIATLPSSEVS